MWISAWAVSGRSYVSSFHWFLWFMWAEWFDVKQKTKAKHILEWAERTIDKSIFTFIFRLFIAELSRKPRMWKVILSILVHLISHVEETTRGADRRIKLLLKVMWMANISICSRETSFDGEARYTHKNTLAARARLSQSTIATHTYYKFELN